MDGRKSFHSFFRLFTVSLSVVFSFKFCRISYKKREKRNVLSCEKRVSSKPFCPLSSILPQRRKQNISCHIITQIEGCLGEIFTGFSCTVQLHLHNNRAPDSLSPLDYSTWTGNKRFENVIEWQCKSWSFLKENCI